MSTATAVAVDRVEQTLPAQERLFSLDVFRGATIAAMIVVNNQSSDDAYWPLQHARWNGWTPTDLVFPFFLFIVGFRWSSRFTPASIAANRGARLFCTPSAGVRFYSRSAWAERPGCA